MPVPPHADVAGAFDRAADDVRPLDAAAMAAARDRQDRLAKPKGSLGRLEDLSVQLAGIAGACPPLRPTPAAVAVFVGDHGVVAQGVTPWPQEVTTQMASAIAGGTAAVSVLARLVGATVTVVDVGVATPLAGVNAVIDHNVRRGTGDLTVERAMTTEECRAAFDAGAAVAAELVASGARALVTGEMGIGNTTPAAAVIAALLGVPAAEVTGRGTGVDDAGLARKTAAVQRGLDRHAVAVAAGPLEAVAALGGLELAALVGFTVGGAAAGVPVVIDGVTADAALLAAERLVPGTADRCIAGHRSVEPGAAAVLDHLALRPVLDLEMRLGEGTGACLALPLLDAAAHLLAGMATLDSAGVVDDSDDA